MSDLVCQYNNATWFVNITTLAGYSASCPEGVAFRGRSPLSYSNWQHAATLNVTGLFRGAGKRGWRHCVPKGQAKRRHGQHLRAA